MKLSGIRIDDSIERQVGICKLKVCESVTTTTCLLPSIGVCGYCLFEVNFPGGSALKVLVGCVALPQALDERGGGRDLTVEVLLPLLLLDFESEPGAKYAL